MNASVSTIACSFPPSVTQRVLWQEFFHHHFGGDRRAQRIWTRCGVERRHGAVDPRVEDLRQAGTARRMRRFVDEALPLGKQAVTACLDQAGLCPEQVEHFTVVTCTGYASPGLDTQLARDLGMSPRVERLQIGHMGCYAALPALAGIADSVRARGITAVLLCLELTSVHVQPPSAEIDQMVAHALFSDAAAAVVVQPDAAGLTIVDVAARTDFSRAHLMTWDVTDLGFRMGLSPDIPDVLARHVRTTVPELLTRHGLSVADVAGWAIHPAGPVSSMSCKTSSGWKPVKRRPPRRCCASMGTAPPPPSWLCCSVSPPRCRSADTSWRWRSGPD
ncbi:MAG TPA: hypothetical protein VM324_05485 [Egibacteraceae bacterium]|nr:hypothetical protein [Egibacteraceae bacterium]